MSRKSFLATIILAFCLACISQKKKEAPQAETNNKFKTLYTWKIIQNISWPAERDSGYFRISVIGKTSMYDFMKEWETGRNVNTQEIRVQRYSGFDAYKSGIKKSQSPHVLYIGPDFSHIIDSLRQRTSTRGVLIITEKDGFLRYGSMVNFVLEDSRVRFEIGTAEFERNALVGSPELLALATNVYNGDVKSYWEEHPTKKGISLEQLSKQELLAYLQSVQTNLENEKQIANTLRDENTELKSSNDSLFREWSNLYKESLDQKEAQGKGRLASVEGDYYALIIGNNDYELDELDLDKPLDDAGKLKRILESNYNFQPANIVMLSNTTRDEIFESIYNFRQVLTRGDNLLIFYAGHGYWDENIQQGYWWPVDADPNNPSNWLSNSDLREQIRGINSAHTLLISDACFSGAIFKTRGAQAIRKAERDIQLLYKLPSRRAMTSGGVSSVPDNSIFFKYLSKNLKENKENYLLSSDLFDQVRENVLNNSIIVPQEGVIMETGDEGGDFVFIRKNK